MMADLENGLWAGDQKVAPAPTINYQYVTAMAKGKKGGFALKGGNGQGGTLRTLHEGARPEGYEQMKKQGAISDPPEAQTPEIQPLTITVRSASL